MIDNLDVILDENTKSARVNQFYQSNVNGLFFCGNALHIHDLVDWVSLEARKAGLNTKAFVKNELLSARDEQPIYTNMYIKTTVPQQIDFKNLKDTFDVSFRSTIKSKCVLIKVTQSGKTIKEKKDQLYKSV